jgi:hypothetical protein
MGDKKAAAAGAPIVVNLFDYTEEDLLEADPPILTYYQEYRIAPNTPPKKAYRKASLKYHLDKTGRGDDDYGESPLAQDTQHSYRIKQSLFRAVSSL